MTSAQSSVVVDPQPAHRYSVTCWNDDCNESLDTYGGREVLAIASEHVMRNGCKLHVEVKAIIEVWPGVEAPPVTSSHSTRFEMQQHEDGQVYITENGAPMLHAQINGPHDVEIQVAVEGKVTIDKLYGPTIFWDVRVSMDLQSCEWVIERSMGPTGEFKEWCRIPGQLDEDFSDHG